MSSCGGRRSNWEFRLNTYRVYCKIEVTYNSPHTTLSENLLIQLGIDMIIKHQVHFRTGWMVTASRAHDFVPTGFPQACTRRHSHDHLDAVSVRFKLPPLHVPVRPSPIWREAGRDLRRSIGLSTMVVFKLQMSLSAHPLYRQIQ